MAAAESPMGNEPITKSYLVIVEGPDDQRCVNALIRHLALAVDVEVRHINGISNLHSVLRGLPGFTGFNRVRSLGVIRDADNSAQSAFQSVCSGLRIANLPEPKQPMIFAGEKPRVGVFIWPDCNQPGTLETLCLASVVEDAAITCVDEFLACVEQNTGEPTTSAPKARLQAFLAAHRKKPFRMIGDAADANVWPWNHAAFDPIKAFLRALVNEA